MTITPEQFNKLATKQDLEKFVTKDEFNDKIDKVLTSVDGLAKKVDNFQTELASNQGAHDRMQGDIVRIEEHIGSRA
jgi:hypothetical protein